MRAVSEPSKRETTTVTPGSSPPGLATRTSRTSLQWMVLRRGPSPSLMPEASAVTLAPIAPNGPALNSLYSVPVTARGCHGPVVALREP